MVRKAYDEAYNEIVEYEQRDIIDNDTGEVVPACIVTKRFYNNESWSKVFLQSFLSTFGIAKSKQVDVICYIYENMNPINNVFLGTYKSISKALHVSEPTIAAVMTEMQSRDIIRKIQNGAWQINPSIIARGDEGKRRVLVMKYETLSQSAPLSLTDPNT